MNCEELNRRYGAPGRIVFREGPQGYPIAALANQYGSAEISLFGAQVLSYRPTGNFPVLYAPKEIAFGADKADHGGIPVCWPWFGKNGPEGSYGHGFARRSLWRGQFAVSWISISICIRLPFMLYAIGQPAPAGGAAGSV